MQQECSINCTQKLKQNKGKTTFIKNVWFFFLFCFVLNWHEYLLLTICLSDGVKTSPLICLCSEVISENYIALVCWWNQWQPKLLELEFSTMQDWLTPGDDHQTWMNEGEIFHNIYTYIVNKLKWWGNTLPSSITTMSHVSSSIYFPDSSSIYHTSFGIVRCFYLLFFSSYSTCK